MLNAHVYGGTQAGTRKPFAGGHGPACVCSKCQPQADPPKEAK